ncbi:ParM/StbA family protein [Salinithrix halophila]|uniref:ParM/StbA family protein n=1 Tax=Salinithrix halophila TaxID=1485204 RepID=A0ABV8JBW3_9BACL
MLVAGIDAGRSRTKVVTEGKKFAFPSQIVPFYEHGGEDVLKDENDMVIELLEPGAQEGEKFFVGEVTEFVQFGMDTQRTEQEKATMQARAFTLSALYRLGAMDEQPCIIGTGVPYIKLKEWGPLVKEMLEKKHRIRVYKRNGFQEQRIIHIANAFVVPEGMGVFYDDPTEQEMGIGELGSVTMNYLRMKKKRVMPGYSGSTEWGCDNLPKDIGSTPKDIANLVIAQFKSKKWPTNLPIRLSGGKTSEIVEHVRDEFPNTVAVPEPLFGNARGFYKIARAKAKQLV